jgi:hypothetical protein
VDISVDLTTPAVPGNYQSDFKLRDGNGTLFGVTNVKDGIERPFWVRLNVLTPVVVLDLASWAESASWRDGVGTVYIRTHVETRGEVYVDTSPHLETGAYASTQGIVVMPEYAVDGYLEGWFYLPVTYTVQQGDRFVTTVGCRYGANCMMEFRLSYISSTGDVIKIKSWFEKNEGKVNDKIDIDLSYLAGQTITLVLTVAADGDPIDDVGIWLYPRVTGYR